MNIEVFSHFKNSNIIEYDELHITYRQRLRGGWGTSAVYPVLPGIEVIKLEFKASSFAPTVHKNSNIIEINHCFQGRVECKMEDGFMQYASEGDLFLNSLHNHSDNIELPSGYYCGMVVMMDIDIAAPTIAELLSGLPVGLHELTEKFFAEKESFMIQSRDAVQRIFTDMYSIPDDAKPDYYRLKVLELILYLHYFDAASEQQHKVYTRQQVDIVKQVQKALVSSIDKRYTIEELAGQFCISPTALKSHFKGVYGKSIGAYMKEARISHAASLLRKTDMSVEDISHSVGYGSQSNFSAVFKEIMKKKPLEYRQQFETK